MSVQLGNVVVRVSASLLVDLVSIPLSSQTRRNKSRQVRLLHLWVWHLIGFLILMWMCLVEDCD